jgi:hypothetical protein
VAAYQKIDHQQTNPKRFDASDFGVPGKDSQPDVEGSQDAGWRHVRILVSGDSLAATAADALCV